MSIPSSDTVLEHGVSHGLSQTDVPIVTSNPTETPAGDDWTNTPEPVVDDLSDSSQTNTDYTNSANTYEEIETEDIDGAGGVDYTNFADTYDDDVGNADIYAGDADDADDVDEV